MQEEEEEEEEEEEKEVEEEEGRRVSDRPHHEILREATRASDECYS